MELTIERALQKGKSAQNEGKLQEAEYLYGVVLKSDPNHPEANNNLGVLAVLENRADIALPLFRTALETNPETEKYWLSYIDALIKEKQIESAKRAIQQVKQRGLNREILKPVEAQLASLCLEKTEKSSSPSQQQMNNLLNHYKKGQFSDSEALAISITKEFPLHQFGWKALGVIYGQTGRISESLVPNQTSAQLAPHDAQAHYNLGITLKKLGELSKAEACYKQAIALKPDHAEALYNLGITLKELGKLDEASASYQLAVAIKTDYIEAHNNLGNTLQELGKLKEAEASYTKAIALRPGYAEAHYNLGCTLHGLGRSDEAEASYQKAIALQPNYAEAHNNLGFTLQELGRLDEAERSFRQAIAFKSNYAEAHSNLGNTLKKIGRLDEAEIIYLQAIALKPDYAEAYSYLGNTLKELGRLDEAKASHTQAILLRPDYAEAHSNLGLTLKELGCLEKAEESQKQAIALKPDYAEAHNNLGNTLQELGRLDEAEASYKQAIVLKPDYAEAYYNLSFTLLNSGRLKEGLDEHEWRWKVTKGILRNRHFRHPLWDGHESLHGKRLLLWSEQGIGDTINWASCLPLVASLAGHTILECQEKIVPLLARSFPNIEIKPEDRSMDLKRDDFDYHLPMGSLYRHFIPHIGENSNIDAYLIPNQARVKFWRDRLGSLGKGPYIGVAWKSSKVTPFRLKHYPPISEWTSVLTVPDVTFINLQYSDFADELSDIEKDIGVTVHNFDDLDQYNDVDDVVALCAALDMVVSTKVTPLIFSSGVGTPTKVANWRQSTWNSVLTNPVCSSVEMFHRDTDEPWANVFKSIAEDLLQVKNKISPGSKAT